MSPVLSAFLLLAAAGPNLAVPSASEMAKAIGEFTRSRGPPHDIRNIACQRFKEEPTEAECKWQQKSGARWRRYSSFLAVDARGWHLIDEPAPIK